MEITEVRVKLMEEAGDRLQAFCSVTLDDCFVVRDLKIIEGPNGPFVAMPSRKLTARCPQCSCKNHLRAAHCNQCGLRLKDDRAIRDENGRAKLYADIAHPINSQCREVIQQRVIQAYREELEKSGFPGYVSSYDDYEREDQVAAPAESAETRAKQGPHYTPASDSQGAGQGEAPPAEQPRGPHQAPSPPHTAPAPQQRAPGDAAEDGFGAGIF